MPTRSSAPNLQVLDLLRDLPRPSPRDSNQLEASGRLTRMLRIHRPKKDLVMQGSVRFPTIDTAQNIGHEGPEKFTEFHTHSFH